MRSDSASVDPFEAFGSLPAASSAAEFGAVRISEARNDYLAKSPHGEPVFLLHDSSEARYSPSLQLRHVTADFHATCRVLADREEFVGQFCMVVCDAEVPELHELFVRCLAAATLELPASSTTKELEHCLLGLRDLFRAFGAPGNRELSGLWAELFVIAGSTDTANAVSLWHNDPLDRYDFSSAKTYLEVKATSRSIRVHSFSLEQLEVPSEGEGAVASLLLQPLTGGVGVLDLARRIEVELGVDINLRKKLWRNVAFALGSDFCEMLDRSFDESFAARNLMLYAMADVPKPERPADQRISSIRFVADLSTVESSLSNSPIAELRRLISGGAC